MTRCAPAWDAAVVNERNVMSKSPTAAQSTSAPRKARVAGIFAQTWSRAFISAQLAIVLAVIAGSTALIAYEWHAAHAKPHHSSAASGSHHHKHKHEPHTAGDN